MVSSLPENSLPALSIYFWIVAMHPGDLCEAHQTHLFHHRPRCHPGEQTDIFQESGIAVSKNKWQSECGWVEKNHFIVIKNGL